MLRKPSYCCNCGDKVERVEWHIWNSKRFCELCETEYLFDEWWPRAAIALILVFGFTGIGFHYAGDKKQFVVSESRLSAPRKQDSKSETKAAADPAAKANSLNSAASEQKDAQPSGRPEAGTGKPTLNPGKAAEEAEEIFYCSAITKKGTPCARRVKGGGRCWQHKEKGSPETKEPRGPINK